MKKLLLALFICFQIGNSQFVLMPKNDGNGNQGWMQVPITNGSYLQFTPTGVTGNPVFGVSYKDTTAGQDTTMFQTQWAGQRWTSFHGSFASPVTSGGSSWKFVRFQNLDSTVAPNKPDIGANSGLYVINTATINNYGQPIGITGIAQTYSKRSFTIGNDAAGLAGYGRAMLSSTGLGIGAFFEGRRDGNAGSANAAQFSVADFSPSGSTTYNPSGFDSTSVIWISNHGTAGNKIVSGIKFGNAGGIPMQYGIGFSSQSGSAVTKADFRTDDTSMTAIQINGTHRTAAIQIANGAGNVVIGNLSGTIKATNGVLSILTASATPATTGTMTTTMTQNVFTITPTGACTFNASGGQVGSMATFIVTTSGTSSFVLTFGTNFKSQGTLTTGTTTAKVFAVTFVCKDGTLWVETGRTIGM